MFTKSEEKKKRGNEDPKEKRAIVKWIGREKTKLGIYGSSMILKDHKGYGGKPMNDRHARGSTP